MAFSLQPVPTTAVLGNFAQPTFALFRDTFYAPAAVRHIFF
jgi:hypothetical protein